MLDKLLNNETLEGIEEIFIEDSKKAGIDKRDYILNQFHLFANHIIINPEDKLVHNHFISVFTAYLSNFEYFYTREDLLNYLNSRKHHYQDVDKSLKDLINLLRIDISTDKICAKNLLNAAYKVFN
jgi:hypothetical protein